MDDPEPTRRSARGRIPNKKYFVDTIEVLDSYRSDLEAASPTIVPLDSPSEDEEFRTDPAAEEIDAEDDESVISADEVSDRSGTATPIEDFEEVEPYTDEVNISTSAEGSKPSILFFSPISSLSSRAKKRLNRNIHSRGVVDPNSIYFSYSKESHIKFYIGLDDKDVTHLVLSRDKWIMDPTLPSRNADSSGCGGMAYHFSHTPEKFKSEATLAWNWYYDRGGRSWMSEKQITKSLSTLEVSVYLPKYCNAVRSFLMGPYESQKIYKLSTGEHMKLSEAWQDFSAKNQACNEEDRSSSRKPGWILNLGTPIRCLAWAPNQNGDTQYLAVASPIIPEVENLKSSAFAPSKVSSACIQIWAFTASGLIGRESFMDANRPPKLVHAICTDWGYVKALSWCPYLRHLRDEQARGKVSLGLLAGIWGDGYIRVLDIQLENSLATISPYSKPTYPPFSAHAVC